jgi:hypothetical protein
MSDNGSLSAGGTINEIMSSHRDLLGTVQHCFASYKAEPPPPHSTSDYGQEFPVVCRALSTAFSDRNATRDHDSMTLINLPHRTFVWVIVRNSFQANEETT